MKNRRDFLKEVCPTVAFALFGVSFLEACSADSLEEDTGDGTTPPTDKGYTKSGSTYTIDLTHSNFSQLTEVGGWKNAEENGISALFLRISETTILAYSNICPNHGLKNRWELLNTNNFICKHDDYRASTDCQNTTLDCYETSLSGNELTVTTS